MMVMARLELMVNTINKNGYLAFILIIKDSYLSKKGSNWRDNVLVDVIAYSFYYNYVWYHWYPLFYDIKDLMINYF